MITWLAIWIFWVIFTKESEWYPSTSDVSKKWLALVSWWYVVLYVHTYISKSGCVPQFANFESVMDHIIWKARPPTRPGRGGGEEDKKKLWKWTCQLYCDVIFWSGAHHTYVCVCMYMYARIEGTVVLTYSIKTFWCNDGLGLKPVRLFFMLQLTACLIILNIIDIQWSAL